MFYIRLDICANVELRFRSFVQNITGHCQTILRFYVFSVFVVCDNVFAHLTSKHFLKKQAVKLFKGCYEPCHQKNIILAYANNNGAHKTVHQCSLTRALI